jgi:hypothetical protein
LSEQGLNKYAEVGADRMMADKKKDCRLGKSSISRFWIFPGTRGMAEEILALWSKAAGQQTQLQIAINLARESDICVGIVHCIIKK